jgi:hypothetical protein
LKKDFQTAKKKTFLTKNGANKKILFASSVVTTTHEMMMMMIWVKPKKRKEGQS